MTLAKWLFVLRDKVNSTLPGFTNKLMQYVAPVTGFGIVIGNTVLTVVLDPAGTLASGSVTFPALPLDGQTLRIATTQSITALTLVAGSGQTIKNPVTALAAGTAVVYLYRGAAQTWYRVQ